MADLVAIFDPELELGAIIDTDNMRAIGPVGGGPNARAELTQFIERMPEAVFTLSPAKLVEAWMQFWTDNFRALYAEENDGASPPVVEPLTNNDDAARLAEHEARAAGDSPPPPAPADADMEIDTSAADSVDGGGAETKAVPPPPAEDVAPYEGPCFACDGTGTVPGGTGGDAVQCNLCKGTGRITAVSAS